MSKKNWVKYFTELRDCPVCKANLVAKQYTEAQAKKLGLPDGVRYITRMLAGYDWITDRTVCFTCPDCRSTWSRDTGELHPKKMLSEEEAKKADLVWVDEKKPEPKKAKKTRWIVRGYKHSAPTSYYYLVLNRDNQFRWKKCARKNAIQYPTEWLALDHGAEAYNINYGIIDGFDAVEY